MFRKNALPPPSGRLTEVLSAPIGHSSLPIESTYFLFPLASVFTRTQFSHLENNKIKLIIYASTTFLYYYVRLQIYINKMHKVF